LASPIAEAAVFINRNTLVFNEMRDTECLAREKIPPFANAVAGVWPAVELRRFARRMGLNPSVSPKLSSRFPSRFEPRPEYFSILHARNSSGGVGQMLCLVETFGRL